MAKKHKKLAFLEGPRRTAAINPEWQRLLQHSGKNYTTIIRI